MTQETKCKDLINVFDKIGGVLSIDYDRRSNLKNKKSVIRLSAASSRESCGMRRDDQLRVCPAASHIGFHLCYNYASV